MSLTQPIMNLEKTSSIPQESTFVVEMGDGSGTKAVTKENLEKSTGEALKIGNLEELQTEAKGSIVAAINEAAQSGSGGSAVDILDTKEEIEANTESGKAAGAQAVKEMFGELNNNLTSIFKTLDATIPSTQIPNSSYKAISLSYTVPNGYKVIGTIGFSVSGNQYANVFGLNSTHIIIGNPVSGAITVSGVVTLLLCKKGLM